MRQSNSEYLTEILQEHYSGLWATCGSTVDSITWKDEHETTDAESTDIQTKFDSLVIQEPLKDLRKERNAKLAETDWWASSDLTMTVEQTAYRQALRDITDTYSSLDDVEWPTKP